jgi:hypothetical protein
MDACLAEPCSLDDRWHRYGDTKRELGCAKATSTFVRPFWRPRVASMLARFSALAFWPLLLPSFWRQSFWSLYECSCWLLLSLSIAFSLLNSPFLAQRLPSLAG